MTDQTQPQTAIGLLAQATATAKAAIELAVARGLPSDGFVDKLTEATKTTLKDNIERVMGEWEEATEADLSNAWLQALLTAQAVELGRMAVESIS